MPKYKPLYSLYKGLKESKYDVPDSYVSFQKTLTQAGDAGAKSRRGLYQSLKESNYDVPDTYEDFYKNLFVPVNSTTSRALKIGENPNTPTVNRYRQKMFDSVDPNKNGLNALSNRAVGQAVKGMNNVRKPVTAKVVNQKGKPTGEEFAITPAKTVEDLDREYAQEVSKNWENRLTDQMADADKDAAKISDMFKSFIGSTDEVGSVWGNMTRGGGIAGTPHSVTTNNGILENTEARQILAAGDYNRKRRELLQLEQDSRNGAIFDNHSFFRGMYDAAKDTGFLTGGASDLINAGSLLATKQDLDNGIHTEAGDMLMQQAVKNSDAQSLYGDNQGWMYTGGVITTNMAPFMVQIGSAGFSKGMSNAIGKVVQGAASKVALGTMEKATGMAGAHIANYIGKVTGLTTKAFGKAIQYGIVGAAQANTVGLGNVANDVANRYTGQVYQDEQGNYKFGTFDSDGKLVHEGGEDFLTALVKGEAAQTIEFATELAGGGIDAVGTALKNFVTKGGKKIINKYNMENVSKVIDFLLNNKVSKNARYLKAGADRTLGKVELNSIVGESLEEELGIIANTVFTGDNKISDLWDEKQQSQIWGGMLLSIGLMKGAVAPFHAYNAKQYYSYKHRLDKADVNLSQLLGKEKWEELRNQIDATTNEDMPEMVNKINRDVALGKNRQPVREYIQNLLIMRGYDIGNMLAAKKAVEDKGEGVSVKNMEKNQAYQQGRDAYGYDTHEIQLDQEDKQKSLAQLLGISEQQLASMSDEELETLSGRDDNIDRAIYDYQLSSARYEGVVDNARDQIDLEVQRAAQAVDMYTDKSRNTIRNATIKATGGLKDYGVYIINGNIATHEDGTIDISNSDDMILYYDPTTNTVEHADAMMFAELGSEENADEVRSQAMADAKEKAIKETTGIIDGVVEVGTQFKTVDADGTEHTYEVLADNGDGTAMITIDGNIPTEFVKGENVQVPVSFEELQKMKDASDQQRLQAAKAQREQMEKERAEQQMQAQTTKAENPAQEDNIQSAPIEDNLDYSDIIREDGKVQMVDVSDKDGNNLFPDAKDVFYIQGNKMRTKFAYIDADGELKNQSFPTGLVNIKTRGEVSVDDYKKYRNTILAAETSVMPESSMIEDNSGENRGEIEAETSIIEDAEPIGTGAFGNIYNQFKGKVKEAFNFLMSYKSGDLLGVFHRDDVGDIDLVWGNEKMGLAHILGKHVGEGKDFETPDDAIAMIENVVNSGRIFQDNQNRYTLMLDGVGVGIRKSFDGEKKNWVVTAVDFNRSQEEKGIVTNPTSTSHGVTEPESTAALNDSDGKDINNSSNGNENNESLTFEDGTPIPVDKNGEVDLSQTDAAHAAEWYDNNLGEDADDWLDGEIKKAKKVLEQAKNKKLAGTKPSELVASKKEKEAAIADAQAHYDSAISIRDSLKERRIAKEENTPDGRRNLIEKARRRFARLKSAVNNDAEAVSQLYRDTVGSLLHRLYDGTGIDVTDTIPLTAEEYVASNLGAHSLNYEGTETSKDVKQETGLSREDFAKTQLLAADGKGTTIDALIHSLWENRPSNLESLDTQDIRNALIGVLNSGFKASEARNFVENIRIAQAENILEEQKRAQENAAYAEQQKAEQEAEQKAMSDEKAESEAMLDNESDNESNDLSNETDNEQKNDNINDNINVPEDATDENPLGLQLSEDKVPFEIKGGKSGETYNINDNEERQRLVNDNKVDDKDILDIDMPKHVHKAIKELCKKMGLKVQFLYMGARSNGWIENGTMYLALDTEKATQFVFGHEMTHAIKQKNPEAYKELVKVAMAVTTRKKFEEDLEKVYQNYYGISGYNNIDDYVEEVVADNLGKFINDFDLAQKFSLRLNHPVLATILHAIQRIKSLLYGDFYKSVDALERIVEKAYVDTANGEVTNSETGEDVSFSLRQKPEPKKKGIGYKVFVLKDGKLYPPMVANPDGAATPVGVWLDADAAPIAGESKTGRPQVKQGGKGTQGGSGKLAYRPGWHLGVVPYAIQFNRKDAEGNKTLFPKNFVFAEVEYAADVDYQEEARQEGINPSGKYQHSLAGLKHLPTDGYYMYRTNPNPETDPWVITGAMKVNRILTRAEQAELVKKAGREPQQIQEGDIVTDDVVKSINQEIAAAPKFSLKVYHGSGADFTEFDFDHMGEGEGTQAFGWGTYVSEVEGIAKAYAKQNTAKRNTEYTVAKRAYEDAETEYKNLTNYIADSELNINMYNIPSLENNKKKLEMYKEKGIQHWVEVYEQRVERGEKNIKEERERIEEYKLKQKEAYQLMEEAKKKLDSLEKPKRNLYSVEIPDDTGRNYIGWDEPLGAAKIMRLPKVFKADGWEYKKVGMYDTYKIDGNEHEVWLEPSLTTGKELYRDLTNALGSDKAASEFLSKAGFVGVKVIAQRNAGGNKEGKMNYVIFDENNAQITSHTKFSLKDNQGNPLNQDGTLKLDKIKSVDELTDEDFTSAFRNVELPAIPKNVDAAIGANGKPIVIKKNIFEKNWNAHKFTPAESKKVLNDALYNTDLVGHTQPTKKPNHWVAIKLDDKSPITVLEVNDNKDNVEVVGWYTLDERNLGRIKRQAERNGGELIMLTPKDDKVESLSTPPLSSAAKIDNSSETAKENGEKFSLKDEKTLAGVHNITEEKLLKAIKQGGLANPSVAVIDSTKQKHESYGDISLILPSDKVAKRTGKNAGTWQGDAWTPTYPQVEKQISNKGSVQVNKDVLSVPKEMQHEVRSGIDRWVLDGNDVNSGLKYLFLHEKGVAPKMVELQHKYSDKVYNDLKSIISGNFDISSIGKADAQKVLDMYIDNVFGGDRAAYEEKQKYRIARYKKQVAEGEKNPFLLVRAKNALEQYDKYGFYFDKVQEFVRKVERDHRMTGVDTNATLNDVEDYIKTNNLTDEFNTWREGKEKEYGIKEVIFDGFTPSGNRRYVPNTLENVSKIMKKQGRNGATGTAVSFQNFAARLMPSYGTLKDIRSKKGLLTSDREEFDKFRDKWSGVFYELGMKCQPDATGTFEFYGLERLSEAAMTSDPQAYLKKEYNVDFSDEDTKRLKEMVKAIKEEQPAMYFETKFERPVSFDEFSSAVVPSTASNEVKQALQNAGVQIYEYDKEKEGDRKRAFNEAINSSDNIRFSLAGERGAAAADKAEERTTRMDFLSVARKMEEEKKDAKAIKIATGWERGADGKWRFEIPDFHFNYEKWKDNNKELLDSMDDKDYRNIMRYEKEFYEDLSPIRKKNFDELRSRTGYKIKQELTLGDVLDGKGADTLFKYYPELRDVKFKFSNLGADTFGIYNNKTKTIEVNDALLYSPRKAERNLQHEVQHVIQHLEGFAKGGNQFQVRGEVKKKFSEVIKQIRQLRAEGKEDEAKAIVEKNRGLYNAYTKNDDYNSYKSLAGEVEARNVQERMNMTPEERRKTLAESTEDVARKDQIFLGVGDVSFSLRDMADGKESGAADMAEDLKSLNTPDEVDDAIKTAIDDMPSGWKMANKKMIHIAQALGENRKAEIAGEEPKFSLKDGSLIKAGTYFSGGGLVEEGLKGIIDPVLAVEYDEKISGVYRNNFGQHIVTADVRDVDPKELVKQIDGEVEYFHASPVCKNYSQAKSNHAEVELDKETAASTAEFINAIKPKVVTIENVKGYKDSEAMKIITDALDANGYTWDADVYNAADYGGYTNRERLIVRAVRDGKLPEKPKKMAHKSGWYEAVADIIPTLTEKKNGVAPWMDVRLKADGIDWRNIDKPLYVMGSAYADGKIPHAFADELLPTLRTKSGDVIVMPDGKVYRAMSRVLARVSGVSDDYKMPFSENLSHTIIGNGIPTQLTEHVIAPLLQNTLRPTTPEDGNTKFSLRGSTPYDKQMEEWMEKNHLEKGAVPMEKPIMKEGENIFDYANRMVEWTRNQNLWKTAPKQTGFQDALDKWKADNGLSPDAYPPVRPHRENYSTEIGYAEDLEEYNKKKELWKSAPKPKDFDLSVDLEDMNKQLRNIRRAVLNQKNYDQRTVKAVSDLVRKMLNIGWGDGLSRGKVGNLLSAAKNATGANDVKKYLDKAMGILAENYLNRLSTAYDNLINTKGARADQSGVIKMGSLDAKGQAFMSEYKKAINMDDKSLNNYIANIEEDSAKNEDNVEMNDYRLAGIQAAIMYKQQIGGNDADISELQRQIDELKNKKGATKEDKDLLKSLEKKLFENKFDRITMYENLLNNIQRMVKESKGRAKEFREQIAEHKNEILHRANLDLEGVDSTYYDTTTAKKKFVNNDLQRAVFSSTYTFEQFLKFFGKHSANGEGRLYNYFHKLNQDALDEEQLYNEMNRNALDEKTKELFGKNKFMNLVGIDGKGMKEMDVEVTDYSNKETGKRTIHLKQGQMLYIYLVNKETDGEMKLRAMGITEEDVTAIEENLDPRVKAMGEWLQDEYLPECQRRYQATHTKFFGAPMKEVENYFPLAINNRARNVKEDVNQDSDAMSQLAGTSTGAIVTRRVNVIPLDIENADAFEVAFNHLQEMEEWSAMLPFRQDINTLLSYTHFRNQVQNMSSVAYGSGKTLWDEFKQTAQIAAGTYKPKVNSGMMDSRIAAAMGGIAVAKISGRLWTAIKQSQSATVFLPECDFTRFVKNGVNPYGSWKWAMENIPDFRKRVENMTYGDVKLRQYLDELEKWHDWTKTISKIGMAPNILVDGITCAVGARSVYETEVNRLTKLGYPKEKAEEKAYYKAVAAYNKTQQSSGGMYLSPMQVDRTYVSAALSLFKNANYAYGRMQIEACRGLARTYDLWGGKHKTTLIESMTRQIMEEDGLDENTARTIAKATYNRTFRQSIGRLINFATLVPVTWALYKVLPYLLTGDDDDKKKDMIEEAVLKGFATSLSDNYVIPFASNILNAGLKVEDGKPTFDPEVFRYQNLYINPATSDLANIYSMVGNQKWYSVANKLGMLGVQSLIGFNPETVGALYQALSEADKDNGNTAKEWQIGILKAISAPEESIRELYMDELGLKSGDIKKIPLAELEKRYAERQINRDNLLSQVFMDAETFNGYVDKYQKSFEKKIKDKMDKWDEYDKKKADEFFDTTSDPKLKDMIEKKRAKDANDAADEQIAKEGLNQEKKGKEPSEEAYDAVKMSIDVAEDNAISTYNKVLNKRYAALNDEYNNQTDAMKYIFMSKHPYFKAYKDLESEYTTYDKKMKELKEKLVSADGYNAKQTILKQIRDEREKFSELQSKVR